MQVTNAIALRLPPLRAHWLRRAVVAGAAWGVLLTSGFTAMSLAQCGGVCLGSLAMTAMTSMLAGVATIGPLAAFGRDDR